MPSDIEYKLDGLIPLFQREGVLLVYLFGSLGKGLPANDMDLAVMAEKIPIYQLREKISDILGTERVDLVDLRSASPVLRFELSAQAVPCMLPAKRRLKDLKNVGITYIS